MFHPKKKNNKNVNHSINLTIIYSEILLDLVSCKSIYLTYRCYFSLMPKQVVYTIEIMTMNVER